MDVGNVLDTRKKEPVDAVRVGFQESSLHISNGEYVVFARNHVDFFDFGYLPKVLCDRFLLPQFGREVDECAHIPFHFAIGMIVFHGHLLRVLLGQFSVL